MRWLLVLAFILPGCSDGPRFKVEAKGKRHRFVLYAGNNRLLLASDPYKSKSEAKKGVERLRKHLDRAKCVRKKLEVKASNGVLLARSDAYEDKAACEVALKDLPGWVAKAASP